VLLLRGPQTPGELRARAARLCELRDVRQVEAALQALVERADGPLVARLPREPGRRESRYAHLFSGEVEAAGAAELARQDGAGGPADTQRIEALEREVQALREELDELSRLVRSSPAGEA
jgi:hypothetical protein